MKALINGSESFKSLKNSFAIGATTKGYVLKFSADKEVWSDVKTVPANENVMVVNCVPFAWFKLDGNTDEDVTIIL